MIEKTIKAGEIVRKVLEEVKDKVFFGAKLIDVAEFVEKRIIELGAKPAFPCNISVNSDAAHFTPKKSDERVFNKGDVVKIDVGAHIDGFIADSAITIDLGENKKLVEASKEALKAAIDVVKAGVDTTKIGETIEDTIKSYGFRPVINLTGHGLLPYLTHAPPNIYNYKVEKGVKLEDGMVIAIEPFATDGVGRVDERSECEIYGLLNPKATRLKMGREIIKEVAEKYKTLPFAKRWLSKAPDLIIDKLVKEGAIREYRVLSEVSKGIVSQWEHTVIVEAGGARVVT